MIYDLAFPHLKIYIYNMINHFTVFGFDIAFYGIIIALAMIVGFSVSKFIAQKSNQNIDIYYDLFIYIMIFARIGARIYYAVFNFDYYSKHILEIFNIGAGGLAVYGGIIACIIVILLYSKIKNLSKFKILDTCSIGLVLGQAIGRWVNFFNMEAYGSHTDNIFAMQMRLDKLDLANVDNIMLNNKVIINDIEYVNAHPTLFYESVINLLILIVLLFIFFKMYKFIGQIFATYLVLYGLNLFFIEGLRTDSLMLFNFNIRVSQFLSVVIVIMGIILYFYNLIIKLHKNNNL